MLNRKSDPQKKVKALWPQVRKILEVVGHPGAQVDDSSSITDFCTESERTFLERIERLLGVTVKNNDRVVKIAERLKA